MMLTCPYMRDVGLKDYIVKVLLSLDKISFTCYVDVWSVKAYGLIIGLLSTCFVMGIHMYITLFD